jgi:hypothetical protein
MLQRIIDAIEVFRGVKKVIRTSDIHIVHNTKGNDINLVMNDRAANSEMCRGEIALIGAYLQLRENQGFFEDCEKHFHIIASQRLL